MTKVLELRKWDHLLVQRSMHLPALACRAGGYMSVLWIFFREHGKKGRIFLGGLHPAKRYLPCRNLEVGPRFLGFLLASVQSGVF